MAQALSACSCSCLAWLLACLLQSEALHGLLCLGYPAPWLPLV